MNTEKYVKLPRSFYTRPDVTIIARELIGKILFSQHNGIITAGRIVETEAYNGREDKACHAFMKRTKRTDVMYGMGGHSYIYLCYGVHHLFNIVTNKENLADAVLIRALEPLSGVDEMKKRRNTVNLKQLASGPGKLSEALGLHTDFTGTDLTGDFIWIARDKEEKSFKIEVDRRINVDYAEEDSLLPWRFLLKNSSWVSKKIQKNVITDRLYD